MPQKGAHSKLSSLISAESNAMSSRRGGYGRGKNSPSHRQHYRTKETWTVKPTLHHNIQTHETSCSSSTLEPLSGLRPEEQKRLQNRGNSWSAPRNRGGKLRLVKKSVKEEEASSGASGTDLRLDSSGDINEKEEISAGRSGFELNLDSNNAEIKVDEADGEKGEEKVESSNSGNVLDEDEAVKRLKELKLSVEEEPELSEETLSINRQLQEDELLAMESIYGDNIFILDNQNGSKCFQAHIHVEVPKGLHITARLNSSNFQEKGDGDNSDISYSFQVEYLPPIILTCLLPNLYPSKCAPLFTIYVQWLGSAKISELCHKLDSIWQEQTGQEVIYRWVEWLHCCTLTYLGFNDEIVLGPYGVIHDEDGRAIAGSVSPYVDIPLIKSHNDEQHHENFCRNIQRCCVCFSEFAGSEFIRLPCLHFFCGKCMKTFSDMHVKEGTVLKLKCLEAKCEGMIPPSLLKRLLGEEEFEHWESLMLQKTLESMTDVVYCPQCETACLEDEDNHAQCSKCFYSFCTLCRERRHVGVSCMTPDMKLVILQERQRSILMNNDQRRREQDMINQILSMKEINRFARQCPSCKMAISRTGGCNKMVCDNCGQYFCYRCNRAISGYEHFRNGKCELFPSEEIWMWEQRMNHHQVAGPIPPGMFSNQGQPCPNCGQHNVKYGNNNHIFCWSCQNHYCYLCKKMVRRTSQHYGPKGCKQHTMD